MAGSYKDWPDHCHKKLNATLDKAREKPKDVRNSHCLDVHLRKNELQKYDH